MQYFVIHEERLKKEPQPRSHGLLQCATDFDLLAKKARHVAVHNASMADRLAVTSCAAQKVQRHVTEGRKSFFLPFVFLDKEFELQSRRQHNQTAQHERTR